MSQFYRMYPARWNNGTADLSLEQEAAFLRIVNAIHMHDEPLVDNDRVLAGLFRADVRKAKHLKRALVDAGKITIASGFIHNERADTELEHRANLSATRAKSGRGGGEVSAKSRKGDASKPLKTNKPHEANASPRIEENRIEENREERTPHRPPKGRWDEDLFDRFWSAYPRRDGANPRKPARDRFRAACKSGADPEAIIAGAVSYRQHCEAREKVGTPYVAQATTWLNQQRWADDYGDPSVGADGTRYAEQELLRQHQVSSEELAEIRKTHEQQH